MFDDDKRPLIVDIVHALVPPIQAGQLARAPQLFAHHSCIWIERDAFVLQLFSREAV